MHANNSATTAAAAFTWSAREGHTNGQTGSLAGWLAKTHMQRHKRKFLARTHGLEPTSAHGSARPILAACLSVCPSNRSALFARCRHQRSATQAGARTLEPWSACAISSRRLLVLSLVSISLSWWCVHEFNVRKLCATNEMPVCFCSYLSSTNTMSDWIRLR